MPISKIIGRNGQQCFKITNQKVSGNHVRIDYDEYLNQYTVTDLNSTNGTYIMEDNFGMDNLAFHPVQYVTVGPGTWLNLGGTRAGQGLHFLVNQVKRNHEDFSREFNILAERHTQYKQLLEDIQMEQKKKAITMRIISGAITILLVLALGIILPDNLKTIAMISASTIGATVTAMVGMKDKNSERTKRARENAQAYFVCPKCGKPLNEYMINARECLSCKAH